MKRENEKRILGLAGLVLLIIALAPAAHAATGDYVATVNFSQKCPSGVGVGIAYDGQNLWYSCTSGTDLYRADPFTGNVTASYDIVPGGGLGALAYDAARNAIWAGYADSSKKIRLVHLNTTKDVTSTTEEFVAAVGGIPLDDGLAYDAEDDTLYLSPDVDATITQFHVNGSFIKNFTKAPGSACGNSGLALGGSLLYEGFNGCNQIIVVNKTATSVPVFNFSTLQAGDLAFRDEDLECDTNTFASTGRHVMWSVEAYDSNILTGERRALAFEIPFGSCGIGGQPAQNGSISGMKFNDIDGDGVKDLGEPGLANWTIKVTDSAGNSMIVMTDASGNYNFTNLPADIYTVSEVQQPGWAQTAPQPVPPGVYTVNLSAGENAINKDFGNRRLPPRAACIETVNPAGKNIPPAGKTTLPGPKGGQNEDGFYRLLANDELDPNPQIFVNDTGSGTIFGPFANGTKIKYTEANGATPSQKTIGGPNSAVAWHITGTGDAAVYAVNNGGVKSAQASCLVPPPPK